MYSEKRRSSYFYFLLLHFALDNFGFLYYIYYRKQGLDHLLQSSTFSSSLFLYKIIIIIMCSHVNILLLLYLDYIFTI